MENPTLITPDCPDTSYLRSMVATDQRRTQRTEERTLQTFIDNARIQAMR